MASVNTGRTVIYSMALAQAVGLLKAEATIQATIHIGSPWVLRMVIYGLLGLVLSGLVAWLNVRLVRRLE